MFTSVRYFDLVREMKNPYNHPASTWEQIKIDLRLDTSLFFMSVGWLAREDKLLFDAEGKKTKVSLNRSRQLSTGQRNCER